MYGRLKTFNDYKDARVGCIHTHTIHKMSARELMSLVAFQSQSAQRQALKSAYVPRSKHRVAMRQYERHVLSLRHENKNREALLNAERANNEQHIKVLSDRVQSLRHEKKHLARLVDRADDTTKYWIQEAATLKDKIKELERDAQWRHAMSSADERAALVAKIEDLERNLDATLQSTRSMQESYSASLREIDAQQRLIAKLVLPDVVLVSDV